MRIFYWSLPLLVGWLLVALAYFGWMHSTRREEGSCDALIVLGQRSENGEIGALLQERLDTAVGLFGRHRYRCVIVSGGAVGGGKSEAEIMREYLLRQGVPPNNIVLEAQSRNTVQNIAYCRTLLRQANLKSCVLVSNSFHLRRMKFIANKLNVSARVYADRSLRSILFKQWKLTFEEIRAYRLSLPWIEKLR
ncbi:MAG TPA: YdcF family protein [Paenibacillus sp.]|nr:YdcF family protein [Paenibacillus sp.]